MAQTFLMSCFDFDLLLMPASLTFIFEKVSTIIYNFRWNCLQLLPHFGRVRNLLIPMIKLASVLAGV